MKFDLNNKVEAEVKAEAKAGFGIGVERSVASCVSHAVTACAPRPRLLLLALLFAVTALLVLAPVMERGVVLGQTAVEPDGTGAEGDPYLIASFENLLWISENSSSWSDHFKQTANIDASATSSEGFNGGAGWSPIGNTSTKFTGSYDGGGKTISNLYINRSGSSIALFGQTDGAAINNLGLIDPSITVTGPGFNVGTLVGFAAGTSISQSFASGGSVTAEGSGVGGLVGQTSSASVVSNSYAIVAVDGASDGGFSAGLVGVNSSSTIINSYAAGNVVSYAGSKGLTQNSGGTITNSFYDSQTTGQTTGSGTAKTTVEMQQQSTFIGWDFQCETTNGTDGIWGIDEGEDYPVLSAFGFEQTCPAIDVTQIWTDFDGFWFSAEDAINSIQPDNSHNLLAFKYGTQIYSTGVDDAKLTAEGISFVPSNWRALPIESVPSPDPCGSSGPSYLVMLGQLFDGVNNGSSSPPPFPVPPGECATGETLAGFLTMGERGLDLGTGLANIPEGTTLTYPFSVNGITEASISDGIPDIFITQLADPAATTDVLSLLDTNGDVVGNPIIIDQNNTTVVGNWRVDFYQRNGTIRSGSQFINSERAMRFLAIELSQFGIDATNYEDAVALRWVAGGSSDPAFFAFNEASISIPTQVAIENDPQPSTYGFGAAITPPYEVAIKDGAGSIITEGGNVITASLESGTGSLEGTLTATTNTSGIATFDNLLVKGTGEHTIRFSNSSLDPAVSDPLTCTVTSEGGIEPPLSSGVYQVSTVDHLLWIAKNSDSWSGSFVQTADIDAASLGDMDCGIGWSPIGTSTNPFTGSYDGGEHKISNLTIDRSGEDNIGLFGALGAGAVIGDLTLEDPDITGQNNVGVLAGQATGATISGVSVTGTAALNALQTAGGIVGRMTGGELSESFVDGLTLSGIGTSTDLTEAGGLVGLLRGNALLSEAYADVTINAQDGSGDIGGLVGRADELSLILNTYAIATINGQTGIGSGTPARGTGGLIGQIAGENVIVVNSYAASETLTAGENPGGLIGLNAASALMGRTVSVSAEARVSEVAQLLRARYGEGADAVLFNEPPFPDMPFNVYDSFWDAQLSGVGEPNTPEGSAGGIGLPTLVMKAQNTYTNTDEPFLVDAWDFDTIWEISNGSAVSYPYLQNLATPDPLPGADTLPFAGGSGTPNDPFQIADWTQLSNMRNHLAASFILNVDLDDESAGYSDVVTTPAGNWEPVGTSDNPFSGSFDGNEKTIHDLVINRGGEDYVGLFGFVQVAKEQQILIQNLTIANATITGQNHTGVLAGRLDGRYTIDAQPLIVLDGVRIEDAEVSGQTQVGGLAGSVNIAEINESHVVGTDIKADETAGLIAGVLQNADVFRSAAEGTLDGNDPGELLQAGGLAGYALGATNISESWAVSTINGSEAAGDLGGLIGRAAGTTVVTNSYALADITGPTSGSSDRGTGGLIGRIENIEVTVDRSYASSVSEEGITAHENVGGLIGLNVDISAGTLGARPPLPEPPVNITNSFWDVVQTGLGSSGELTGSAGGTGKSNFEMKVSGTFTNTDNSGLSDPWNFEDTDGIWEVLIYVDEQAQGDEQLFIAYPYLSNNAPAAEEEPGRAEYFYAMADDNFDEIGLGTEASPFRIKNWRHLHHVHDNPNAFYLLIDELDSIEDPETFYTGDETAISTYDKFAARTANDNAGFRPIGTEANPFTGVFRSNLDGETFGFSIAGFGINRPSDTAVGLFAYTHNATFERILLIGQNDFTNDITGGEYTGGLIGRATGTLKLDIGRLEILRISGTKHVGALAGKVDQLTLSSVRPVENTIILTGNDGYAGGLIGLIEGTSSIDKVRDLGLRMNLNGESPTAGGIIGEVRGDLTMQRSYVLSNLDPSFRIRHTLTDGTPVIGGMIGRRTNATSGGTLSNSYTRINIEAGANNNAVVGGLIGDIAGDFNVDKTYSANNPTWSGGDAVIGGLVAQNSNGTGSNVTNSYWDVRGYRVPVSAGGEGLTTGELQNQTYFKDKASAWGIREFNMVDPPAEGIFWEMLPDPSFGNDVLYPTLVPDPLLDPTTVQQVGLQSFRFASGVGVDTDPFLIETWEQLNNIRTDLFLGSYYRLDETFDEDSPGYDSFASETANDNDGWEPIGSHSEPFRGVFRGENNQINDLVINRGSTDYVGLFGRVASFTDDFETSIENLGLTNVDISGQDFTGGLAGSIDGENDDEIKISQVFVTGTITGRNNLGGLAGSATHADYQNVYSVADVGSATSEEVGGLFGTVADITIVQSYAAGKVTGAAGKTGGIAAGATGDNTATHVFFDGNATGETTSAIGAPKTPEEMRVLATFNDGSTPDWSIATTDDTGSSIWQITEELSYPYFRNNEQQPLLPGTVEFSGLTKIDGGDARGEVDIRVIPIGDSDAFAEFDDPPQSNGAGLFSVILGSNINYGLYARATQAGDPVSGFFEYPKDLTGGIETQQNILLAGRNITITDAATDPGCFIEESGEGAFTEVFPYEDCNVQGSDINNELADRDVRVVTAGNITVETDPFTLNVVAADRELAFLTGTNVNINSALTATGAHPLNLRIETDTNVSNTGNFTQGAEGDITTNNGDIHIDTITLTANAEMNAGTGDVLFEAGTLDLQAGADIKTTSGTITLIADAVTEVAAAGVTTDTGEMLLTPRTLSRQIDIAGTTASSLQLSETLLNTVLSPGAEPVFIGHGYGGSAFTATITVFDSEINHALDLKTSGLIQLGTSGSTSGKVTFNENVSLETGTSNSAVGHIPVEMAAGKTLTFRGGGVEFDRPENKVPRIVGDASTSESFTFVNAEALEVGKIETYGLITIQTVTGDLNLTDAITSSSNAIDAIRLFADTQRLRGDFEGGQINASAETVLSTASGGNVLLYTGSIRTSPGIGPDELDVITIAPANYRFNKDATDAAGDLDLDTFVGDGQRIFAILRETVAEPPVITFARPFSTTMEVSFTAPLGGVGDGGSNVTGYEFQLGEELSEEDSDWNTLDLDDEEPDLSAYFDKLVSSLEAGATVTIRVRALNLAGAGTPSTPVTRTLFAVGDGTSGSPFRVDNLARLNSVRYHVGNPDIHFEQTAPLTFDLGAEGDFAAPAGTFEGGAFYNNGAAWEPIGSDSTRVVSRPEIDPAETVNTRFSGVYDGGNHLITGLRINREDQNYTGLFGYVDGNNAGAGTNKAIIRNLALEDADVTGGEHSGMLAGRLQDAEVSEVYTRGTLTGERNVGGIAGSLADASIENSYSISEKVSAELSNAGGIAGLLDGNATLNKVYASSIVSTLVPGASRGALAGAQASAGNTITNAFWNEEYSGLTAATGGGASIGGAGLTQASIRTLSTFDDTATPGLSEAWDIALRSDDSNTTSIWQIIEDVSFPFFRAFPEPPRPGAIILAGTVTNAADEPVEGNTVRIQPAQSGFAEIDPITTIAGGEFSTEVADYLDYQLFSRQEVGGLHSGALIVHQAGLDPSGLLLKLEPRTMTIVDGIVNDIGCRLENGIGGAPNELFAYVDCEVGANEIETEIQRGSLILRAGADIDMTRSVRPVFEPARTLLLEAGNDVILRANRAFEPDEQDNLAITIVADANNDENGSFIMEEGATLYHGAADLLVRANHIDTDADASIASFERAVRFRPVGADRAIAITPEGTYSPSLFTSVLSPVTSQITVGGDGGGDAVSSAITLGDVTFGSPVRLITTGNISQEASTAINTSGFSLTLRDASMVTLEEPNVADTLFANVGHLIYTSAGSFRAEDIESTSGVIRLSTLEDDLIVNRVVTSNTTAASGSNAAIVLSAHTSLAPNTLDGGNIVRVDTSVVTAGSGGAIRYNTGTWAGSPDLQSIPLADRLFNADETSSFTSSSASIVAFRERVPDEPEITFARPFADSLQVSFTLPAYTGTGDIERVEFSLDDGTSWIERTDAPSDPAHSRLSVFTSDTDLVTGGDAPIRLRLVTTATPGVASDEVERTLFAGGDGSTGAPLQVASTRQLNSVRYQLDKHIVQNVDLAFDSGEFDGGGIFNNSGRFWEPIGSVGEPFTGFYNGNEKTITDLKIGMTSTGGVSNYTNPALFASVGTGGTIRDLGIIDPDILGSVSTGALVSNLRGGTLEEVYVSGGSVSAISIETGGLVGTMLGGLISRSYAHTTVTNTNTSSTTVQVGGLVGNFMEGRISQSWSAGTITAERDGVGGLIGIVNTVSNEGVDTEIIIEDVYSVATVQARDGAGALFGALRADRGSLTLTNAYAAGNVTATGGSPDNVGGVLGRLDDLTTATILNTFWDANATGQETSPIGTSKTPEQMRRLTTFTNTATSEGLTSPWSIALTSNTDNTTSVWQLTQGFSYPYLRAVTPDPLPGLAVIAGTVRDGVGTVDGLTVRARPVAGFPELTPQTSADGGAFTFTVADNIDYDLFTRRLSGDLHEGGYTLYDGSTKTGLEVVLGVRSLIISSSATERSCIIESGEVFPYADCTVNSLEVREALQAGDLVLRAGGTITQAETANITAALPVPRTLTYEGRTGVSLASGASLTATVQPLAVGFTSSAGGDAVVLAGAVNTNGGPVTVSANSGGVTYSAVLNTGGGTLISETADVTFTDLADVNTGNGDIRLSTDALISNADASLSTTGTLTIEPATSTLAINAGTGTGGLDLSATFLQDVIDAGLLVIGNDNLDAVITVGASFGSELELRTLTTGDGSSGIVFGTSSFDKDILVSTRGPVTQTGAVTATGSINIQGTGGSVDLHRFDNDFSVVQIGGTGSGDTDGKASSIVLYAANAFTLDGLFATGEIFVTTAMGDLTIDGDIVTDDTGTSALILIAGRDLVAGSSAGGNLVFTQGTPVVTVGDDGRALFYAGSLNGSTGLSGLVDEVNNRYFEVDFDTNLGDLAPELPATGFFALLRETTAGAPIIVAVLPFADKLEIRFDPPTDDGGSDIVNYQVLINNDGGFVDRSDGSGPQSPILVSGLDVGSDVTVQIRAMNTAGGGAPTDPITRTLFAGGEGTVEDPLQVSTVKQLNSVRFQADKHFVQTEHLALDDEFIATTGAFYNDGALWQPIGTGDLDTGNPAEVFTGTYDGGNRRIDGLRINRGDEDEIGLFGHINGAQAQIKQLGLTDLEITGQDHTGGVVGKLTSGELREVYVYGSVTGRNHAGGLAGSLGSDAKIEYAYSVAGVTAENHLGGLVGSIDGSTINETYAAGAVALSSGTGSSAVSRFVHSEERSAQNDTGNSGGRALNSLSSSDIGGLIGSESGSPTVTNSFFDQNSTGQTASAGGTASSPAAMRTLLTYSDVVTTGLDTPWEIALANGPSPERWKLNEGLSYPYFTENIPPDLPGTAQLEGAITLNGGALGGETTLRARPVAAFPERSVETSGGSYSLLVANNLDYDLFARVAEGELFAADLVRFEGETNSGGISFTGNDLDLEVRSLTIAAGATEPACILEDGLLIPYANCSVNANEVRDALLAGNLDVRAQNITVDAGVSAALPAARTLQLIAGDAITLAADQSIETTDAALNLLVRTNATSTAADAFGTLTLEAGSAVDVRSGALTLAVDNLALPGSGATPQLSGTGPFTLRSARDSRAMQLGGDTGDESALRFTSELLEDVLGGGFTTLTVGHTAHDAAIDVAGAELRSNLRLISGGTITQSGALTSTAGLTLSLTLEGSGSMTLDDSGNSFVSLSISGSGTGSQHYVNAGVLTVTGVTSGGPVTVATIDGNLDIQGDITTTDASTQAIRLIAGRDREVGDGEGGNVRLVGSTTPDITAGAEASILIYSAVLGQSTGLFELAGEDMDRVFRNTKFPEIPEGAASKTGIVLLLRETVPDAPHILTAAPFSDRVVITFTPPAESGGTDIRNYEFTIDDGATYEEFAPVVIGSPAIVGDLTPGQTVELRLRAVNEVGAGDASTLIVRTLFDGGEGTESEPLLVSTLAQLDNVRYQPDKQFLQTAYLAFAAGDFAAETGGTPEGAFYNGGAFWQPIGSGTLDTGEDALAFSGVYNGGNHGIEGLRINRTSDNIGLFGHINGSEAEVRELGLVDVDVTGGAHTGALAGLFTEGTLEQVYTTGEVTGTNHAGGIAGRMETNTSIINSYTLSEVAGEAQVGGLTGSLDGGTLEQVYAAGPVILSSGSSSEIGGLIGSESNDPDVENSFWDTVTTGQASSAGDLGAGKVTGDMTRLATYNNTDTDGLDSAWDIALYNDSGASVWLIIDQNSYPYFRNNEADPLPGFNENARFARVNGNWGAPSTWTVFGCSPEPGPAADSAPSVDALVSICADRTVSVPASAPVSFEGTLEVRENGVLRVRTGSTLTLAETAETTVRADGRLSVDWLAGLTVGENASLTTEAGGTSVVRSGGQILTRGTVTGDLRFERIITGPGVWTSMASPVSGARYGSPLNNDPKALLGRMFTRGFPGSDNPAAPANIANVLEYNEEASGDRSERFVVPQDNDIASGTGFFVFTSTTKMVGDEVEEVDYSLPFTVTGEENTPDGSGNFTFPLTYSDTSDDSPEDGWNLLGNPYGSALDWAAGDGWTKPDELNGFIYLFNPETQSYVVSDPGAADASDGLSLLGDPIIGPFQAFWVKAESPDPGDLVAHSGARTIHFANEGLFSQPPGGDELRETDPESDVQPLAERGQQIAEPVSRSGASYAAGFIQEPMLGTLSQSVFNERTEQAPVNSLVLSLDTDAGYVASLIRFGNEYQTDFGRNDAYYLASMAETFAYLFTEKSGRSTLVNSLPQDLDEPLELPLAAGAFLAGNAYSGEAELRWQQGENMPDNLRFELIDLEQDITIDMHSSDSYRFNATPASVATLNDVKQLQELGTPVMRSSFAGERFIIRIVPGSYTGVDNDTLPTTFELSQNYPNPFNPSSTIQYALPEAGPVRIEVFSVTGQLVAVLVDEAQQQAGRHTVVFDGSRLASGVYLYRMVSGRFSETRKMTLIK